MIPLLTSFNHIINTLRKANNCFPSKNVFVLQFIYRVFRFILRISLRKYKLKTVGRPILCLRK